MPSSPEPAPLHVNLLLHIALERDAEWAAKLAVLRLRDRLDIEHFGACVAEHQRHGRELAELLRAATGSWCAVPVEPTCSTGEPSAIGAVADPDAVLEAMRRIESARVRRYEELLRSVSENTPPALTAMLDRHAADACARLAWVDARLRRTSAPRRERAA